MNEEGEQVFAQAVAMLETKVGQSVEADIAFNSNAWWFYEPDFGWFWTTRNLYPQIYRLHEGWMVYLTEP